MSTTSCKSLKCEREKHELRCKFSDFEALVKEREWKGWESRSDLRVKLGLAQLRIEALEKEKQELLSQIYSLAFPTESC